MSNKPRAQSWSTTQDDTGSDLIDSSVYPDSIIVEPSSSHKQSWIVLHGRGDTGKQFGLGRSGFLRLPLPDGRTLREHLPHARFIFPTASPRRSRTFGDYVTQWFDIRSWDSSEDTDWQIEGLRETSRHVHTLLKREIDTVGAENVVLGGLSQGCANVLIALLLWQGERIRCVFGMSGWLPLRHLVEEHIARSEGWEKREGGARESDQSQVEQYDLYQKAMKTICDKLEVSAPVSEVAKTVPIFMAHGAQDNKVDIDRGREATTSLRKLGLSVTWKEYETLIHWMRGDELKDVSKFVDAQGVVAQETIENQDDQ